MSAVMGLSSDPDRICKNSITQWRHNNNSGEIDVFEAARYFSSGGGDIQNPNGLPPQRVLACRISLEMPSSNLVASTDDDRKQMQEKKKYKQPSSPGGKLASFLNSLFNQTTTSKKTTATAKKKKNMLYKSGSSKNDVEEERKRRSSISHFRMISTTNHGSKPSTCANTTTPTKSSLRSLSHHQIEVGVSAPSRNGVDQKRITSGNDINYKNKDCGSSLGFSDRSSTMNYYYWGDEDRQREFMRKFSDEDDDNDDDGADSDSSSDLFDLDFCSSTGNLPVYGTTHVDRIRIHSAPISAVSTVL